MSSNSYICNDQGLLSKVKVEKSRKHILWTTTVLMSEVHSRDQNRRFIATAAVESLSLSLD